MRNRVRERAKQFDSRSRIGEGARQFDSRNGIEEGARQFDSRRGLPTGSNVRRRLRVPRKTYISFIIQGSVAVGASKR